MTSGPHPRVERDSADAESFRRARDLLVENYDDPAAVAGFAWPAADTFNWALDWFDRFARDNPAVAVAGLDLTGRWREVTYDALAHASDSVARRLRAADVHAGDRVVIESESVCELWAALIGILKAGAVCVPTHFGLHAEQFERRLAGAGPKVLVTSADRADSRVACLDLADLVRWDERLGFDPGPPRSADLPAFGCFTSGTTGAPKLALHSHRTHGIGHLSSLYWSRLGPGRRHLNVSSPGWAKFFWSSLLVPLTAGATVVPWPQHFTAADLCGHIEAARADSVCAPVVVLRRIDTAASARPESLRDLTSVGEKVDERTRSGILRDWGLRVREGFGQTEATAILGEFPDRPGALRTLPGYDVRLRDDPSHPAPQLQFRSFPGGSFLGYEQDGALRDPVVTDDGWQWTGDYASGAVEDGTLRLLGRGDDVYRSNGHLVSPFEIESILEGHPAVAEAAVTPVADPEFGQASHAFVVLDAPATPSDLRDWLNQRLQPEVAVHHLHTVDRLPRSVNGKIQRRLLAAGVVDGRESGARPVLATTR